MLKIQAGSCVRYYAKHSSCTKCETICPTDAIKTAQGSIAIIQQECIDCGACVGVCPTEALSLREFDVNSFFFDFLKSDENIISCKTNFVCLAALSVDHLIALGLLKETILDIGHCKECDIAHTCYTQIEKNIDEANYILEAIEQNPIIAKELAQVANKSDRRKFFSLFTLKGALQTKQNFDENLASLEDPNISLDTQDIGKIRQKSIPNRRKLLYTILQKINKPSAYKYLENKYLSFTSDKTIDKSCDNCSLCYRICPTEALSSDAKGSKILFDPFLCVRCHLCHDVCEKDSIKLAQFYDTKEFFEPSVKILAKFTIAYCEDCGIAFSYFGGEKLCPRCKIEDEEARRLWGIT